MTELVDVGADAHSVQIYYRNPGGGMYVQNRVLVVTVLSQQIAELHSQLDLERSAMKFNRIVHALVVTAMTVSLIMPWKSVSALEQHIATLDPITLVPGTVTVGTDIESAILQALYDAHDTIPVINYSISDVQVVEADNWLFVSLIGLEGINKSGTEWNLLDNGIWFGLALLHKNEYGHWIGAVEGTPEFSSLVDNLPVEALDASVKQDLASSASDLAAVMGDYRFPWESGTSMQYGPRGVHNAEFAVVPGWKAVDFLSDGNTSVGQAPNRLLAATSGTITYVCRDNTSIAIKVGDLLYAHLLNNGNLTIGHHFNQGDEMGQLKPGSFNDRCGYANQKSGTFHVHFGFPNTGSFQIGGWTLNLSSQLWQRGNEKRGVYSWLQSDEGCSNCPESGGVVLYKHANFDCGCEGEDNGYVIRSDVGWHKVPSSFNDEASSIKIPSGWSVKLYEHDHEGDGWTCRDGDDRDFWGDRFNNGVGLNDAISSFRVFDSPNCYTDNQPPTGDYYADKPSAYGWYRDSVQLKAWVRDQGDSPSGVDSVLFRAQYDGKWHTIYSDGADCSEGNTCDREYTWNMNGVPDGKILLGLDIQDEEGNWAYTPRGVRTIYKYTDYPPSIVFSAANGDTFPSGHMESSDRNWIFQGTADDHENQLSRIEFHCSGDNCGSYYQHSGLSNWTYERHGIAGQNDIYFRACDNLNQCTPSSHLILSIDLAAPSSRHNLIGTMGENEWYTSVVEVRLHADDGSTGNAQTGVNQIRYRLDGGSWQARSGSDTSFTVSTDGLHTVEYYAIDDVGNTEGTRSVSFKIDQTLPAAPGAVTETHGAISGQWQKNWNDPAFTWGAASDTVSGLWYYQVDWADTLHVTSDAAYDPPAVRTGSYQLRVRAVDQAGNVGPEGPAFTFRYDGTPPHAPKIQNNDGIASGVWQNDVRTADFSWAVPHDEGSGIAGYNVYWGPSISGTNTSLITSSSYVDATPICAEDEAAIHHLRVRSQDNVGWQSEWVAYSLAYDGAPPTATLVANYGMTVTNQTSVLLQILADDEGSGVSLMRLSNDARSWSEWTDIAEQLHWEIPAIGRRMQPIYLQVVDSAGNVSDVVSDTVYLEVNRARPKSESFWLWDDMMTPGGGVVTSTSYALRTSVGQSLDAPVSTSANYKLISGFQAGVLAAPIETPGYTSYYQMGHVIAGGGTCTPTIQSATYQMYGTLGQPAHVLTISSTSYTIQSGFWGGAGTDPAPPGSPPPPPPPPTPECEFYSVTINDNAPFTNSPTVSLDLCGPDPVEMMLSNDKYFTGATWQSYTRAISWTLDVSGSSVQSRFVYARFRDGEDEIHETFFDQIIYDPNASEGQAAFDPSDFLSVGDKPDSGLSALQVVSEETTDLFVSALDDSSGLAEMQISSSPDFEGAAWEPYSAIAPITFTQDGEQTVYVRFRDNAGNVSGSSSDSLLVDTTPPVGMANVVEGVVGPTAISATVVLSAVDDTSGVSEVRISSLESFTDTLWQPYVAQVAVPISYTGEIEPVLYVQFRDVAGNASLVYSTTYLVDTEPPVLYVDVESGSTLTRTVTVLAYDELTGLGQMRLSNDPLMIDGVATMPYTITVTWVFDEHKVIWVQLEDSVGNVSEPYPAYAAEGGCLVYLPIILRDYSD